MTNGNPEDRKAPDDGVSEPKPNSVAGVVALSILTMVASAVMGGVAYAVISNMGDIAAAVIGS